MTTRVSPWRIKEQIGKMRSAAFKEWINLGVLPPPDADGRWGPEIIERVDAAVLLKDEVRSLARRAFRLQLLGYPFPPDARRQAALALLGRVRPASGKMARVRREYEAFSSGARGVSVSKRRSHRHPLPPERWREPLELAREEAFQAAFELAGRYASMLPAVIANAGVSQLAIPYEERFVLLLVELLLQDGYVRNKMGLPKLAPQWSPPQQ